MKKYWNYFKYLIEHKKNFFKVCWKHQFFHAIFHDISKFSPIEFISYTKNFFGTEKDKKNSRFEYGWLHHQRKNKHHWDYWVNGNGKPINIPTKYLIQMICDWKAMGIKFGDTAKEFYLKNKNKIILEKYSRERVEYLLNIPEE